MIPLRRTESYERKDAILAMYAPITLLMIPGICLILILFSYTAIYWALGITPWREAFILSGSSLFTLGFARFDSWHLLILIYSEATIGLGLVALLISYLPTMYSAFSEREKSVAMLMVRAGPPPSAVELIKRYHRLGRISALLPLFVEWESIFAQIEETHTSLSPLIFFRSPQPDRSWITASGIVLDGAALYLACFVDQFADGESYQAALCIRGGFTALRRVADFFRIQYDPNPSPTDPISISQEEFLAVYQELVEAGLPIKINPQEAWRRYAGWRVNYDRVLLQLANITMAPTTQWVSDRSLVGMRPLTEWNWQQWWRALFLQ